MDQYRLAKALFAGICPISSLKFVSHGSWGSIWADFEIFEILGGARDIYNSISMSNYCDRVYIHLGQYVNKVLSAWTEFGTCTWPSMASIMDPGGRNLDRFLRFWGLMI